MMILVSENEKYRTVGESVLNVFLLFYVLRVIDLRKYRTLMENLVSIVLSDSYVGVMLRLESIGL
jgi:hypothetical protein